MICLSRAAKVFCSSRGTGGLSARSARWGGEGRWISETVPLHSCTPVETFLGVLTAISASRKLPATASYIEGVCVLDARQHQGKFGEDYVRVLASAAGLIVLKDDLDVDGIDLGFRATGRYGKVYSPTIEAQIKTWSTPAGPSGHLLYRGLDESQFNKLAGADFAVPRFLFVICVPTEAQRYASSLTDGLMLRHLGYFVSLRSEERIVHPDRRRKRPVKVPTANVLTAATLRRLTETQSAW